MRNFSKEKRMEWLRSLKVGDVVCDCRYKHLAIVELWDLTDEDGLYDKRLKLEDGAHCSAYYCCDPHDHDWPHPEND